MKCIVSGYGMALDTSLASFGERSIPMWTDGIESPSFIAFGEDYLFAITENNYYASVYAYHRETVGIYRRTDQRGFSGGELCHIVYSVKNHMLFGACCMSGTVISVPFDPETGKFGDVKITEENGDGRSEPHCVMLNKAEDRLYAVNRGLECVYEYRIEGGALVEEKVFAMPKDSGPRHMRLSQDEKRLYVIAEYGNKVFVCDANDGTVMQTISTLPENFRGVSRSSTLCFSPDGRFLYAANRYVDTIALFSVDEKGMLTYVDSFDCGGRSPRHMEMAPDGSQLAICCQDSDWVVFKKLNPETGLATHTVREIPFNAPACIVLR